MAKKGGIFRYADGVDKLLLVLGTLGSIGDGLMTPLMMLVLSPVINEYGGGTFSNDIVDKYSIWLLFVAIGVGISAFIGFAEGICWTGTAERQASRMRMEYFKSVPRQEVAFFDKQANSSMIFKVISTISSDAHLIHDTITEKIPNCLAHLSSFIICFSFGFVLSWRLAVVSLPFSLMFIVPGFVFRKVLKDLGAKINGAYGVVVGDIEFRDVDFCYPSRSDSPVLQGLNLKVQAGKMVGLVGGSGSGKSTIISLLERSYDPVNGDIPLDGHKLKNFQLQWLRSQTDWSIKSQFSLQHP
ncbi:PREDICTED: ABC transporter [Prunus dulcis]|uniref:PREDICTED: ABC transporter n=1 Tax=Prunus dulcis TaxID=3755 RepID=A0A5E4EBU3_PRUDU|nr:PREDICTED: ABC transporter [Prunus dulcis]